MVSEGRTESMTTVPHSEIKKLERRRGASSTRRHLIEVRILHSLIYQLDETLIVSIIHSVRPVKQAGVVNGGRERDGKRNDITDYLIWYLVSTVSRYA